LLDERLLDTDSLPGNHHYVEYLDYEGVAGALEVL